MQGDFTRQTFDPLRHFSRVLMQQGRVQLDADWNEQIAILLHYVQTLAADVIGSHAGSGNGFKIDKEPPGLDVTNDFVISPGHYYVNGILCELEETPIPIAVLNDNNTAKVSVYPYVVDHREFQEGQYVEIFDAALKPDLSPMKFKISKISPDQRQLTLEPALTPAAVDKFNDAQELQLRRITTYKTQPDYPVQDALNPSSKYLVYLDVWERHLSYLEDEGDLNIREVALGGPDTATRTKVVWQVKVKLGDGPDPELELEHWPALSQAYLRARAKQEQQLPDPCVTQPDAHYRGAENQLYRVEIHTGGTVPGEGTQSPPTFKWSRENASVIFPIIKLQDNTAELANLGRDKHLSLTVGDWVEIVDDDRTLRGEPGPLVQVDAIEPTDMTVTFKPTNARSLPSYSSDSPNHPLLRRWDYQKGRDNASTVHGLPCNLSDKDNAVRIVESNGDETADWFVLEDGVQIQFLKPPEKQPQHSYRSGDYWLIPARTATGDVEWPREGGTDQASHQHGAKAMLPHGVEHHYAPLARVSFDNMGKVVEPTDELRKEIVPTVT